MLCTLVNSGSDRGHAPVSRRKPSLCTSIWRFCPPRLRWIADTWAMLAMPVGRSGGGHLRRWSQGPGTPESGPKGHRQLSGSPGPTLLILFCSEKRTWRGNLFPPHVSIRRPRISTIPRSYEILPESRLRDSSAALRCKRAIFDRLTTFARGARPTPACFLSPPPPSPPPDGSRHTLQTNKHCTISKRGDSLSRPTSDALANTISSCTMPLAVAEFKHAGNPAHANGYLQASEQLGFGLSLEV